MTYEYWAYEIKMPGVGTARSLWRRSDATAWEYRSLVDAKWHQQHADRGPRAPEEEENLHALTEKESEQMFSRAPQEMYVYVQRRIGSEETPGAVSRRIPSPESYRDQVFSIDNGRGRWQPTNAIVKFTNTDPNDRANLRSIEYNKARQYAVGKAPGSGEDFDRPFRADTAVNQQRAATAAASRFQGSLQSVAESADEHHSHVPSPKLPAQAAVHGH
ncbi:hypothetical protein ACFVTC_30340 [Streptomyces sp. NPDC057950]|uniref:hypothetical protein n=1 Tax=Streptomyces sp. NPDC057950 TaxID=3346288 RepID=UPI0036EE6844